MILPVTDTFGKEIRLIGDFEIFCATYDLLEHAYYNRKLGDLPSSRSGKYHPPDERGPGGLMLHMKRSVKWTTEFIREFPSLKKHQDELICATLLHDIGLCFKYNEESKEAHRIHPKIGAIIVNRWFKRYGVSYLKRRRICKYIKEHMSHWFHKEPSSFESRMVALADYVASREYVKTPVIGEKKNKGIIFTPNEKLPMLDSVALKCGNCNVYNIYLKDDVLKTIEEGGDGIDKRI